MNYPLFRQVETNSPNLPDLGIGELLLTAVALPIILNCGDDEVKGNKSSCRIIAEKAGNLISEYIDTQQAIQQSCVDSAYQEDSTFKRALHLNGCFSSGDLQSPFQAQSQFDTNNLTFPRSVNVSACSIPTPSPQTLSCTGNATGLNQSSSSGNAKLSIASSRTQERYDGGAGSKIGVAGNSKIVSAPQYRLSYPSLSVTRTNTKGKSHGGAQTNTHTTYEENAVTNGNQFGTTEGWSNATAVDTAHAANFWFAYKVRNTGTDFIRLLCNVAFNIYIGDNPNPAYTYQVNTDLGGDGCFHNYEPGSERLFSARTNSHAIPLSLEHLKAIDLGAPVRVVLADFSYDLDQVFYNHARSAGVLVAIDDGPDDNDELIENYLIPTWGDADTMQNVLGRYFPNHIDSDGNYTAIWTPETRSDTPTWCIEPKRFSITAPQIWCKHTLSTSEW